MTLQESLYKEGTRYPNDVARIYGEFCESVKELPDYDVKEQFASFIQCIGLFKVDIRGKTYEEIRAEVKIILEMLFLESFNEQTL